jgi:tetratricopeptide (TPR) repeat protein
MLALRAAPALAFGQADQLFIQILTSGRLKEAEQIARQELARVSAEGDQPNTQVWCHNLALALRAQGHLVEAEPLARRALALAEALHGPGSDKALLSVGNLASILSQRGRHLDALPLFRRALEGRERQYGPVHQQTVYLLMSLGDCYSAQGRYSEAEPLLKQAVDRSETLARRYTSALDVVRKALLPGTLTDLGTLYAREGRLNEAEPLFRRALQLHMQASGVEHPDIATYLSNLTRLYTDQGRYLEAEQLGKSALDVALKAHGADNGVTTNAMNNLAIIYEFQHRYKESIALLGEALKNGEAIAGADDQGMGKVLMNLGIGYRGLKQFDRAETYYRRALAVHEKGENALGTADDLVSLGHLKSVQGLQDEALGLLTRAQAIYEKMFGAEHHRSISVLLFQAQALYDQNEYEKALRLLDDMIPRAERIGLLPYLRLGAYRKRAWLHWRAGRRDEAITDLRRALDLAEQVRLDVSESGQHQAEKFTDYVSAFEAMVAWQAERGEWGDVFGAIQRVHARSLLDEMRLAGADPLAGRPAAEREQLRQREAGLKTRVAEAEKRLEIALKENSSQAEAWRAELAAARKELESHEIKVRRTSPVVQDLLARRTELPRLSDVQRGLVKPGDLLLSYLFGVDGGYVLAITTDQASFTRLELSEEQARLLNATPGPLTADRLRDVLLRDKPSGIVSRLANPRATETTPALAALWLVLVPEAQRKALLDGTVKRLFVETEGPLALLPFETLVIEPGEEPKYLLDVGPPVLYGPSATILLNLSTRESAPSAEGREPVLALGDPAYPQTESASANGASGASSELPARSRYTMAGGMLARLPFSGLEAQEVAKAFNDQGIKAALYTGAAATERALRYWAPGRTVLHLACHGLADQKFESLFAALAVAPGPRAALDASDDGFLTLAEIYGLNLKGCELAILSACQSNFGPQQQGEGTWAVSRGFLVAGARRVVASNWLVDDEAAANLVSMFCQGLARDKKGGGTPNYAQSLQAAKRRVRQEEKWKAPFYWASLILVGPP